MPESKDLLTCLELSLICAMCRGCPKLFQLGKASPRRENELARDDHKMKGKRKEKEKILKNKIPRPKQKNGSPPPIQGTVEEIGSRDKALTF